MIDISHLLLILKVNKIDKTASRESLDNVLSSLRYTEADKQEAFTLLQQQGWFTDTPISPSIPASIPATPATVSPVITAPPKPAYTLPSNRSKIPFLSIGISLAVLLVLGGGVAYAYMLRIGPFSISSYTEENIFSGMLLKFNQIETAKYSASGALSVVPRDKDAKPFVIDTAQRKELMGKYTNDIKRFKDATEIIRVLNQGAGYSSYFQTDESSATKPYPASITTAGIKSKSYIKTVSTEDPVTKKAYEYKIVENGKFVRLP